jgi:hypothetical protein
MSTPDPFIRKVRSVQNRFLVAKLSCIGFAFGYLVLFVYDSIFRSNDFSVHNSKLLGAVIFFTLLGLAGFVVTVREELPHVVTVQGKPAKISGMIWWFISWGLAIRYLYLLIRDIVQLLK